MPAPATAAATLAAAERPYLDAAVRTARWIDASGVAKANGRVWPADPAKPDSVGTTLYTGTPGVVLFFLRLHAATGDAAHLKSATSGADALLAGLDAEEANGLYVGLGGVGFVLQETFKATTIDKYRDGARRVTKLLAARAKPTARGVIWDDSTDIVSGAAGTGLSLLYLAKELNDTAARDLAVRAATHLVDVAKPDAGGLKWAMNSTLPRLMPNFSHGTAGVAYFLARAYEETGQKAFLDAAIAGATYLQAVAKTDGDICLIFHNEPDGKDLYYLGWCHGPAGTARLFYQLHRVTKDPVWMTWVERSARGVLESGVPETQTAGFWNNVGQCCGSAGVAEFFLSLHEVTGKQEYRAYAERLTRHLLTRGTADDKGLRWPHAEHRVRPAEVVAQTGYMQGAAGVGAWLLRLDGVEAGKPNRVRLPDTPF